MLIAGIGAVIAAATAAARDLTTVDFSLRFPAALAAFSPYNDVAAVGGASAGSKYQSSANPGATDWQSDVKHPFSASPQFSTVLFKNGPTVRVTDEAFTYKTENWGTFEPAAVQLRSSQSHDGNGSGNFLLVTGDYGQLQWGKMLTPKLGVGLTANYTSTTTEGGAGGVTFVNGHSDTYDLRVGALTAVTDHLFLGAFVDYAITPSTTNAFSPLCGCIVTSNDETHAFIARPGFSYEFGSLATDNLLTLYFDYQYGHFSNNTGNFVVHRYFGGLEQQITKWLFVRAGAAYDQGTISPTAGLGIYPTDNISIDLGYQGNMFPDLGPEFGSSQLFGISLSLRL